MSNNSTQDSRPADERFLYWLAAAAVELREAAGEDPETIAYMLRVRAETIRRFERAEHWPRDTERLVAAYATVGGLSDARQVYQRAIALWHERGTQPRLDLEGEEEDSAPRARGGAAGLPDLQARARRLPPPRPARTVPRVRQTDPSTGDLRRDRRRRPA